MKTLSNNEIYNIFIINPDSKTKKVLESKYSDNLIPQTIFVDSANVFMEANPNMPSESMFHTFCTTRKTRLFTLAIRCSINKLKI